METLPAITPQPPVTPVAAGTAGADAAAEPDGAATPAQEGEFQALLSKSLAGLARGAKSAAGAPGAKLEEDCEGNADADEHPEALPSATDSALALLAALPQAAARTEAQPVSPAEGKVEGTPQAGDSRAGGETAPGAKSARAGQAEAGFLPGADPEKKTERLAHGAVELPEFKPADPSHGAQPPLHAAHAPAPSHGADPAAAGPAPRIETPLGAPGWSTALADRVMMFVGDKQQVAELHINPPHLGPVEITLTVSDDRASAVFASPHAVVRETIESSLPRLREVLAESGINLGQASVTADSPRDGSSQTHSRSSFGGSGGRPGADSTPLGASALVAARRARGLVDLFA